MGGGEEINLIQSIASYTSFELSNEIIEEEEREYKKEGRGRMPSSPSERQELEHNLLPPSVTGIPFTGDGENRYRQSVSGMAWSALSSIILIWELNNAKERPSLPSFLNLYVGQRRGINTPYITHLKSYLLYTLAQYSFSPTHLLPILELLIIAIQSQRQFINIILQPRTTSTSTNINTNINTGTRSKRDEDFVDIMVNTFSNGIIIEEIDIYNTRRILGCWIILLSSILENEKTYSQFLKAFRQHPKYSSFLDNLILNSTILFFEDHGQGRIKPLAHTHSKYFSSLLKKYSIESVEVTEQVRMKLNNLEIELEVQEECYLNVVKMSFFKVLNRELMQEFNGVGRDGNNAKGIIIRRLPHLLQNYLTKELISSSEVLGLKSLQELVWYKDTLLSSRNSFDEEIMVEIEDPDTEISVKGLQITIGNNLFNRMFTLHSLKRNERSYVQQMKNRGLNMNEAEAYTGVNKTIRTSMNPQNHSILDDLLSLELNFYPILHTSEIKYGRSFFLNLQELFYALSSSHYSSETINEILRESGRFNLEFSLCHSRSGLFGSMNNLISFICSLGLEGRPFSSFTGGEQIHNILTKNNKELERRKEELLKSEGVSGQLGVGFIDLLMHTGQDEDRLGTSFSFLFGCILPVWNTIKYSIQHIQHKATSQYIPSNKKEIDYIHGGVHRQHIQDIEQDKEDIEPIGSRFLLLLQSRELLGILQEKINFLGFAFAGLNTLFEYNSLNKEEKERWGLAGGEDLDQKARNFDRTISEILMLISEIFEHLLLDKRTNCKRIEMEGVVKEIHFFLIHFLHFVDESGYLVEEKMELEGVIRLFSILMNSVRIERSNFSYAVSSLEQIMRIAGHSEISLECIFHSTTANGSNGMYSIMRPLSESTTTPQEILTMIKFLITCASTKEGALLVYNWNGISSLCECKILKDFLDNQTDDPLTQDGMYIGEERNAIHLLWCWALFLMRKLAEQLFHSPSILKSLSHFIALFYRRIMHILHFPGYKPIGHISPKYSLAVYIYIYILYYITYNLALRGN